MLNTCKKGHVVICFEGFECPLCKMCIDLSQAKRAAETRVDALQEAYDDLFGLYTSYRNMVEGRQ